MVDNYVMTSVARVLGWRKDDSWTPSRFRRLLLNLNVITSQVMQFVHGCIFLTTWPNELYDGLLESSCCYFQCSLLDHSIISYGAHKTTISMTYHNMTHFLLPSYLDASSPYPQDLDSLRAQPNTTFSNNYGSFCLQFPMQSTLNVMLLQIAMKFCFLWIGRMNFG